MTAVEPSAETLATSREAAESEYPDLNAIVEPELVRDFDLPVIDPSTERTLGHLPLASSSDIEAVTAAQRRRFSGVGQHRCRRAGGDPAPCV